uniref:Dynein, light chain, roadblock-type 1 n=1 Tax=Cyprinus carpio TaxID=7962 RepID=A0A8C1WVY2_CYPCA
MLLLIQSQKGVQGIIIVNAEGIPIKSTLDNSSTVQYAGNVHQLLMKARGMVRDIDPQNDLTFLRVRSKKNEIMIAPGKEMHTSVMLISIRLVQWFSDKLPSQRTGLKYFKGDI